MTVLAGETYTVEGIDQFTERLDVGGQEMLAALEDHQQTTLIADYNKVRGDEGWDDPRAESITTLPECVYEEWQEWALAVEDDLETLIPVVLESRDQTYVHLFDGWVHRVVEVFDADGR